MNNVKHAKQRFIGTYKGKLVYQTACGCATTEDHIDNQATTCVLCKMKVEARKEKQTA